MLTIDALKSYGADTQTGLGRCLNNEAFYLRLVGKAVAEPGFEKLSEAVAAGDRQAAFEAAHALKGVMANLALTPVLEPVVEITELLRADAEADYPALVAEILRRRDELAAL